MTMQKKKTAVEWLLDKYAKQDGVIRPEQFVKALAMEREQIESKETELAKKAKERKEYCNYVDTLFEHNFR